MGTAYLPYQIRPHIYLFLYFASGSDQCLMLYRKIGKKNKQKKKYFLQTCFRYSFPSKKSTLQSSTLAAIYLYFFPFP